MDSRMAFTRYFADVSEIYPSLKSKIKLDRFFTFVQDLPEYGIKEIFYEMVDSCRQAPTPNEFREIVGAWKKRNNFKSYDPNDEIRLSIEKLEMTPNYCRNCYGSGVFDVYAKWLGLNRMTMFCACRSGELAMKLPEYRTSACSMDEQSGYWYIYDFDPNKELKFDLYRHIYIFDKKVANGFVAEIFYGAEAYLAPCYYKPHGWSPDPEKNPWTAELLNSRKIISKEDVIKMIKNGVRDGKLNS